MSFDWDRHLRHTAKHLVRMYEIPGAKGQALYRLDALERDPTWAGLLELIPAAMVSELATHRAKETRNAHRH